MPRESISTPSGASCRRPIPTSRHKKGNPVTPMCLVCRYAVFAAIPLLRRSFPAAAFSAAILALSQCCRAVISPAAAFMRLHFGAPRRASLPCCRLVPGDGRERTWPECRHFLLPALRPGLPGAAAGRKPRDCGLSSRVSSASSGRIAPWRRASYSTRYRSCRGR